jgi:hypothetical protein
LREGGLQRRREAIRSGYELSVSAIVYPHAFLRNDGRFAKVATSDALARVARTLLKASSLHRRTSVATQL